MTKNRIIYAVWLFLCAVLFVLVNSLSTITLLAVSVILPVLFGLVAFAKSKKLAIAISLPTQAKRGEDIPCHIEINNGSYSFCIPTCSVKCVNVLTGERIVHNINLNPSKKEKNELILKTKYCGRLTISVDDFRAMDIFGLFSFKAKCDNTVYAVDVYPQAFEMEISLAQRETANSDADMYSMTSKGNDPGEIFLIREYQPGDPIKNIHHKLSQKLDKLMVKELGLPVINNVAVLVENSILSGDEKIRPRDIDTMLDVLSSLSSSLINIDISHTVFWNNSVSNQLEANEITDTYSLEAMMHNIIKAPVKKGISVCQSFNDLQYNNAFEHIVLITNQYASPTDVLYNNNRVNVLFLTKKDSKVLKLNNAYAVSFTGKEAKNILSSLEI